MHAMAAVAAAADLTASLSRSVVQRSRAGGEETFRESLPELRSKASSLRGKVEDFHSVLPPILSARFQSGHGYLMRHLYFIDYYLERDSPDSCMGDAVDIAQHDLPGVLESFDQWYESQAPFDTGLGSRIEPFIRGGQLNAAIREAWVIFKTRIVDLFELDEGLDGQELAVALFRQDGAASELLPNAEREGYLNLFKGLYALHRNPVAHNDIPPNPREIEAVLALVNSALVRLESVCDPSDPQD